MIILKSYLKIWEIFFAQYRGINQPFRNENDISSILIRQPLICGIVLNFPFLLAAILSADIVVVCVKM